MPVPFFQLTSTLGASNLIDYKLGQLHPLPPIALRCVPLSQLLWQRVIVRENVHIQKL